jgi:hypothetical protein
MRLSFPFVLVAAGWLLAVAAIAQPVRVIAPQPLPRIVVRDARIPVRLEAVDIRTDVIGHAAQTRVELSIRNPNERVLEGELQFPLRDGQVVTGFALDIDGELRPAVPVEKAKGQQVFEDVIRARVDPALLEVTQGNNYKLRVYPLPPHGVRRVVLNIAQTLPGGVATPMRFDLPLGFADSVDRLDVEVRIADVKDSAVGATLHGLPDATIMRAQQPGWAVLALHRTGVSGAAALAVTLPPQAEPRVATQNVGGQTYFHVELPLALRSAPRAAPRRVALLWDASGSGMRRDHGREFASLDAWFASVRNVEVMLRVGRDVAEAPQRFMVKDGRWDDLRQALQRIAYDGASHLAALTAPDGCDLALLFSDGIANWGATTLAASPIPLYALSAAASVDAARLKALAERSGGEWLDLAVVSPADAAKALQTRKPRLLRADAISARQLVFASPYAVDGHVTIAGILDQPQADVTLEIELPDGRIERRRVGVQARPGTPPAADARSSFVAQRWASLRVAELEANYDDNRGEIRRIGKAFAMLTRETSLIVLDAVADYVRYEIEPPASLRGEYERLLAQQQQRRRVTTASHIDRVAARFAQQVAWWETVFPKDDMPPAKAAELKAMNGAPGGAMSGMLRNRAAPLAEMPMRGDAPAAAQAAETSARLADSRDALKKEAAPAAGDAAPQATIRLTPWAPDSPYAQRLREAGADTVYQRYLDERPSFVDSTAFFLDAADVLFAKGQPALALRVLSNLAEMQIENRHILRVLGYRLLQAKQPALAVPVFRSVQRLSPDEPQSHRDLGLALADADQWQEAAEQLWTVVSRPWSARFPDIDLTALAELNAIAERAARAGKPLRTDAFDPRLMRHLPLDLRITLAWDSDNTDIDLWVVDPNGEKTFYGHRLSYQGGRMSQDVTGGYGPEEFALRDAKPGRYTVQAQFYGHRQQVLSNATTLMMRLTTGFGRPGQKDELVTLRLAGRSETITVGSFEVGR